MGAEEPAPAATRVVVLSDTHVGDGTRRRLPDAAYGHLERADLIVHAGDVVTEDLLHELRGFAPVEAVLGNNDHGLVGILPERLELAVAGVRVAVVHDSGARAGRPARLHRWFPDADLVVFGHSHEPCDEVGVDGQRLLNPGSCTWKRRAPVHTLAVLDLAAGAIVSSRLVDLDAG
ncbi:metallophosphatase family protein [Aquihabitans sp. G128]|uniref:metallophosphoesterase family protein n=1 Tax=Aquihabitans sp. G128 TaxID=2849779 RepID=UPI001C2234E2|nr:metallophosphoesterase family protein [Aquihabitans sp. G128]QXC60452.1 metallophosphatase family protein [Aquihabitans sp. G128]